MDEIDGKPLSQAARRNLQTLITHASDARDRASNVNLPPIEKVAASVIDAFKRSHHVVDGRWVPRTSFRLLGGALVVPSPSTQEI